MNVLRNLRNIMTEISKEVEVLPAVGGAVEELGQPDIDEREDKIFNKDENVFDIIFEKYSGTRPQLYRHVPAKDRTQNHLFRYFLDGSFRSYFLGTMLEHERETPIFFVQVGACVLYRRDDGSVQRDKVEIRNLLMAGKQKFSEQLWGKLETLAQMAGVRLVDITIGDTLSNTFSDFDLRNKAEGKVRYEMHLLETECITSILDKLDDKSWLVVDGSLVFEPTLHELLNKGQSLIPVIGVAKNFRKDPQFEIGRGPRAERRSIYKLLADLKHEHRTAAFSSRDGKVVFWYVRLREQRHLDYPLMGVVKVELVNPSKEPLDPEFLDLISSALVAERSVTPHGRDRRWHAHLYPIYLAERIIKESFFSREVIQQYLKWR